MCSSEFSDLAPLADGTVAFSTLAGRSAAPLVDHHPVLQRWITATAIRVSLDKLNTFGDEVLGDPRVLQSYFYAVTDLAVGGQRGKGEVPSCGPSDGHVLCRIILVQVRRELSACSRQMERCNSLA